MERKVYIVEASKADSTSPLSDEEFMEIAKANNQVYSLDAFACLLNSGSTSFSREVVRFLPREAYIPISEKYIKIETPKLIGIEKEPWFKMESIAANQNSVDIVLIPEQRYIDYIKANIC